MVPVRVQFQHIGSQVDFDEKESIIIISIMKYIMSSEIFSFLVLSTLINLTGFQILTRT